MVSQLFRRYKTVTKGVAVERALAKFIYLSLEMVMKLVATQISFFYILKNLIFIMKQQLKSKLSPFQ